MTRSTVDRLQWRLQPRAWFKEVRAEDPRPVKPDRVNLVSVGVSGWSRVEPVRDAHAFSSFDRVLDDLTAHGVTADPATPGGRQHYGPSSSIQCRGRQRLPVKERRPVRALGVPAGRRRPPEGPGRTWAFGRCGEGGPPPEPDHRGRLAR
ncbi:beta-galactosidase [Streptomyces sp. 2A115]|uniref:beta-galactosidase n=1 Tax=Streptomyces sp. 2A115 TaxID=3457439 RepID=UPI003FD5DF74